MNTKFFTGEIKAVNEIEFIMTAEVIDRDGEIIKASGVKINNFLKNPIMFYNHNNSESIGYWRNLRLENNTLVGTPEFSKTELGQKIKMQVSDGSLRACSIGFDIINQELQEINGKMVNVITESELYECSIVTLPANQDAVRIKDKKIYTEDNVEIKAGSELSNKNKELLMTAYEAIGKVLKLDDEKNYSEVISKLEAQLAEQKSEIEAQLAEQKAKFTDIENELSKMKEVKTLNQYLESKNDTND